MQVDLLLDPFGARWAEVRDAASVAVDAGFAGIWTFDHLDGRVYDVPFVLESWTVLSALAVVVPGVMLGPLVLNVKNRHPGVLATMAATLQEVTGGRLLLGLGAGAGRGSPYAREQVAIGRAVAPDPLRRAQVETCIQEVRRLWRSPGFLEPDPEPPFVIGAWDQRWPRSPGVSAMASTRAPRTRSCASSSRSRSGARAARAAIRSGSWSPSTRSSTSGGSPPTRRSARSCRDAHRSPHPRCGRALRPESHRRSGQPAPGVARGSVLAGHRPTPETGRSGQL